MRAKGIIKFEEEVNLRFFNNYRIGGKADYFFRAKNVNDLIETVEEGHKKKLPIFILGGGTNLLISDQGFRGLVIKMDIDYLKNPKPLIIKAGAGVLMEDLIGYVLKHSLSGLEWAGGLPGTLGGAIRGNAGAFNGEIKDLIKEVVSLDVKKKKPEIIKRTKAQCQFNYRHSIFKNNGEVVIEATLYFKKGERELIKKAIEEKIYYRISNHPLEYPNIGSIFKNVPLDKFSKKWQQKLMLVIKNDPVPVIPSAYLISECSLKGISFGGAMISPKHSNFIVNVLDARAKDVEKLIALTKKGVKKKFNVSLEEEIEHVI